MRRAKALQHHRKKQRRRAPPKTSLLKSVADLLAAYHDDSKHDVPVAEFVACLERLEQTDVLDLLVFHTAERPALEKDLVLLDPTRIDAYASALLVAAKDEPDGPGHLLESRVLAGDFKLEVSERLADRASEQQVLWHVVEGLLSRDLALREKIQDQDYLVFPAQCTTELASPGAGSFGLAFGFAGPVRSIYATLIAQLAHYETLPGREFFQDPAAYKTDQGARCLVRLRDHENGTGELEVSFDDSTPVDVRQGFIEFVATHLHQRCVPGKLTRRHAYHCGACKNPFEDRIVRLRVEAKKHNLMCPLCEALTPLVDLLAPTTPASTEVAERIGSDARAGRRRITAEWVIKSKVAQGAYDVFLSHHSKDKPQVKEIGRRLKGVGIRPWLDEWDLVPGETISAALEKAIETIPCAALFFGPGDLGRWHILEIQAYVEAWAKKQARIIPVLLTGVKDPPKMPIWVRQTLWVDMRAWKEAENDAFYRLVCGIVNRRPTDSPLTDFNARDVREWQDPRI